MALALSTCLAYSTISAVSVSPKFCKRVKTHFHVPRCLPFSPLTPDFKVRLAPAPSFRGLFSISCFKNDGDEKTIENERGVEWRILKRWNVPWNWQTISLTSMACGLSFVLTGLIEAATIPYSGIKIEELSLEEKAEILFADQTIATVVVLAVLFSLTKSFSPLPDDIYRYDLREPFDLKKGWLLWAGIGLFGAVGAIALTGATISFFSGETPQRETDALIRLLPLIGTSTISTACLVGVTGVLAPILEETIFRGFFMVSLSKWISECVGYTNSTKWFDDTESLNQLKQGRPLVANPASGANQCSRVCSRASYSWGVSSAICSRDDVGVNICSNAQSSNTDHNSRNVELWGRLASHLSSGKWIRYQGTVAIILMEIDLFK